MNSDSDPLLRALADEDPACPDGRALVALGRLIRLHSAPPGAGSAVADDVLARLSDAEQLDGDHIDACYDGASSGADAQLARLGELVRSLAPRRVDLRDRVLARIRASTRFAAFASDSQAVFERTRRWRIWSAVVAGHCAALLAFAIFEIGFTGAPGARGQGEVIATSAAPSGAGASAIGASATGAGSTGSGAVRSDGQPAGLPRDAAVRAFATLPPHLPPTWLDVRGLGADLFLLRRIPELRQEARRVYGMEESAEPVRAGLAWLIAQQDAATGCFGAPSGNLDRDVASQSVAVLALLAEGPGDPARHGAARRGLDWLAHSLTADGASRLADTGLVSSGLGTLALVEGGLLLNDPTLQQQAEDCLAELDSGVPMQPGAAGLGGFVLLALETAQQGGLHVPGRLLQQSRNSIGRSLPVQENDPGRLGVAAFARFILGHRDNPSTIHQVERLGELLPAADPSGRVDPLAWFFATLAMREAGGAAWERWSHALQHSLMPLLAVDAGGTAHVEANGIRYGESAGAVFATSVTLLDLQAPYRYLPLARP